MTISIGFVGLGSMGLPMARQLLAAGHTVYGFDVAKPQLDAFSEAGGQPKANPRAVADLVSLLILVVATAEQAEAALFGPEGGAALLGEGGVVVLHSTVPPPFTEALAARLDEMGLLLLDAPISGGRAGAEAGTLTVMASGSEAAFAAAAPALDAMAKTVHRLGDRPGIGSTVKMINQHLAGVHIAAACEAMALGTAAGADPDKLYEVITGSRRQFLDVHQPRAAYPRPVTSPRSRPSRSSSRISASCSTRPRPSASRCRSRPSPTSSSSPPPPPGSAARTTAPWSRSTRSSRASRSRGRGEKD